MRRLQVLISAYACEPGAGSEPGIGWSTVCELARFHDVWALTRSNNRDVIERALSKQPVPGLHFAYFDLARPLRFWKRGRAGIQLYYYLWQLGARAVARDLHERIRFDLVHHITFGRYWMPSFLRVGPPFVLGPVGGGESAPKAFWADFGLRGCLKEAAREAARWLGEHDPFVRRTVRESAVAFGTTADTASRLERIGARRVRVLSAIGLSEGDIATLGQLPTRTNQRFRFVSIGHLLHWKGFHLGMRGFARAGLADAEYWIIGDGPERRRLQALASRLGISGRVRFFGSLPRTAVLEALGNCDVLVHPSLHDSGGYVCLEAMCARLPVICLDLGGPGDQVTSNVGIKVNAVRPEQAVRDIATAMTQLYDDRSLREHMGEAGRMRTIADYSWARKSRDLNSVYQSIAADAPVGPPPFEDPLEVTSPSAKH